MSFKVRSHVKKCVGFPKAIVFNVTLNINVREFIASMRGLVIKTII